MEPWDTANYWVTFASRFCSIGASGIAIWVFVFKRRQVSVAFQTLGMYTTQFSTRELRKKIERLHQYSAQEVQQKRELINIFSEIRGYINGNQQLHKQLNKQSRQIGKYIRAPEQLTEPKKRALINELEQTLNGIDLDNFSGLK